MMWSWFSRKGPSGFSRASTAEEVTAGIDGSALTAIVTGASSGIGVETARTLALRGVHVIMGVRNLSAGDKVRDTIVEEIPNAKVDVMELDLSSISSVRNFASNFISKNLPLNILINNAGVMLVPYSLSQDGIELQFATNHIGHFLLTNLLMEAMKKTSVESDKEGRIVYVSSKAHGLTYREGIRFDTINSKEKYGRFPAYGQSKLANILHANELARQFKEDGLQITANSLHPGSVVTCLPRLGFILDGIVMTLGRLFFKSIQQGAATTCFLALHPQVQGVSGKYFRDSNISNPNSKAHDVELGKRLWDFSLNLIKKYE